MTISQYLEEILFRDQSLATTELFDVKANQLFEQSFEKSSVDIIVQIPHDIKQRDIFQESFRSSLNSCCRARLSYDLRREPLEPSSPAQQSDSDFPVIVGPQGSQRCTYRVRERAHLAKVAASSKGLFKVCFIRQRNSLSRLSITRDLFESLMLEIHIFPRFLEFVLLFGAKLGENEIGPPQMRFRRLIVREEFSQQRCSGFECAYGLRFVELNLRSTKVPWSVRQIVIYHRYEVIEKASTWVMISASTKFEASVNGYIESSENISALNPFEIHVLLLDTALGNWRSYIVFLTEEISKQSDKVLVASIKEKSPLQVLDFEERQVLKDFEDKILDVLLALDSTTHTINTLMEKYHQFCQDPSFFDPEAGTDVYDFVAIALHEKKQEVVLTRTKVETLHSKVKNTIDLLSSLLDLGNGVALKVLAEESQKENAVMRGLAEKSTRDAAAVKVLTVITLIYLPVAVVSGFFSTEFVHTHSQHDGRSRIVVTREAWLLAAIAAPLTLFTLMSWWIWTRLQAPNAAEAGRRISLASLQSFLKKKRRTQRFDSEHELH